MSSPAGKHHNGTDTSSVSAKALQQKSEPATKKVNATSKASSTPVPEARSGKVALHGSFKSDSYASTAMQEILDRSFHAGAARMTAGLSPSALAGAYADWAVHLMTSPGKQMQLAEKAARKAQRLAQYTCKCATEQNKASPCI